jgi:hypothetical protein
MLGSDGSALGVFDLEAASDSIEHGHLQPTTIVARQFAVPAAASVIALHIGGKGLGIARMPA